MANNQYVNKVIYGNDTLIDISDTTAEAGDVIDGQVFYTKSGAQATGTLGDATTSAHGLMSASDKSKLDGITSGAAVTDVQINNTSILSNGIANIPIASQGNFGIVKIDSTKGIGVTNQGALANYPATQYYAKEGTNSWLVLNPSIQHISTFYGLSKAAGVDLANETVTLGTYPETSKTAIREMIGAQTAIEVIRL